MTGFLRKFFRKAPVSRSSHPEPPFLPGGPAAVPHPGPGYSPAVDILEDLRFVAWKMEVLQPALTQIIGEEGFEAVFSSLRELVSVTTSLVLGEKSPGTAEQVAEDITPSGLESGRHL